MFKRLFLSILMVAGISSNNFSAEFKIEDLYMKPLPQGEEAVAALSLVIERLDSLSTVGGCNVVMTMVALMQRHLAEIMLVALLEQVPEEVRVPYVTKLIEKQMTTMDNDDIEYFSEDFKIFHVALKRLEHSACHTGKMFDYDEILAGLYGCAKARLWTMYFDTLPEQEAQELRSKFHFIPVQRTPVDQTQSWKLLQSMMTQGSEAN